MLLTKIENPVAPPCCFFPRELCLQVKQLARLSLQDPQYISVHENAEAPTPAKLEQVCTFILGGCLRRSG